MTGELYYFLTVLTGEEYQLKRSKELLGIGSTVQYYHGGTRTHSHKPISPQRRGLRWD
jgi:hypothetical protein